MWLNFNLEQQKNIIEQTANRINLPAFAVEKDAWVCLILKAIFQSKYKESIIFKGGTSLSKAYNIINRFSEDIDLIIDKELLGFKDINSKTQIKKLRKASGNFVVNELRQELIYQLDSLGVSTDLYEINYDSQIDDTSDPNTLTLHYNSAIESSDYVKPRVLIEFGARGLTEPSEEKEVISFIDKEYPNFAISVQPINVRVANPIKTFIEKVLLLHEEFLKPSENIRSYRLSRHIYDLDMILQTHYGSEAIKDIELFEKIVEHRKKVTPLRNISYDTHKRHLLQIIPPASVLNEWEKDYKEMQENMIIGESKSFENLLQSMKIIMEKFKGN